MEWLREKKNTFCGSILVYIFMGMMAGGALSMFTSNLCLAWIKVISQRNNMLAGEYLVGGFLFDILTVPEEGMIRLIRNIQSLNNFIFIGISLVIVIRIYYHNRIVPILGAVSQTVENVKRGVLDVPVAYNGKDRLGEICASVEQIRLELTAEKLNHLEALERQLQLNGAFAHDIRTPLTVIKGYTEFLEKYLPAGKLDQSQVLEKLAAMKEQEERLFAFTNTMGAIQNLEKRQREIKHVRLSQIMEALMRQLEGICLGSNRKKAAIKYMSGGLSPRYFYSSDSVHGDGGTAGKLPAYLDLILEADQEIILEALENIWSNGLIFAHSGIEVIFQVKDEYLYIYVKDDGPGFTPRALTRGAEAYYRETDCVGDHFGLGLTLSSILCERHGGCLTLVNSIEGGAIVTASFRIFIENPM